MPLRALKPRQVQQAERAFHGLRIRQGADGAILLKIRAFGAFAPRLFHHIEFQLGVMTSGGPLTIQGRLNEVPSDEPRGTWYTYRFEAHDASQTDLVEFEGVNDWSNVAHVRFALAGTTFYASNDFFRGAHY